MLREVDEMDTAETANCLQITEITVKMLLHRARIMLKEKLYDLTEGADIFQFGNKRCDWIVDIVMNVILR